MRRRKADCPHLGQQVGKDFGTVGLAQRAQVFGGLTGVALIVFEVAEQDGVGQNPVYVWAHGSVARCGIEGAAFLSPPRKLHVPLLPQLLGHFFQAVKGDVLPLTDSEHRNPPPNRLLLGQVEGDAKADVGDQRFIVQGSGQTA